MRQAKQLGIDAVYVASCAAFASPDYWKIAGSAAENAYYATTVFELSDEESATNRSMLKKAFLAKYGKTPGVLVCMPYESLRIISQCLETIPEVSTDEIRAYLLGIKNFDSSVGILASDADGDIEVDMILMRVRNQKAEQVK